MGVSCSQASSPAERRGASTLAAPASAGFRCCDVRWRGGDRGSRDRSSRRVRDSARDRRARRPAADRDRRLSRCERAARSLVSTLLLAYLALVSLDGRRRPRALAVRRGDAQAGSPWSSCAAARGGRSLSGCGAAVPGLPLARCAASPSRGAHGPLALASSRSWSPRCSATSSCSALTVPPNNWDSLTYHLARVAAWAQHGGYYWIPNAPTDRINEFQPLAEQQILFLFAATGSSRALSRCRSTSPSSRSSSRCTARRGGSASRSRASACASFLLATFTLVALEAIDRAERSGRGVVPGRARRACCSARAGSSCVLAGARGRRSGSARS